MILTLPGRTLLGKLGAGLESAAEPFQLDDLKVGGVGRIHVDVGPQGRALLGFGFLPQFTGDLDQQNLLRLGSKSLVNLHGIAPVELAVGSLEVLGVGEERLPGSGGGEGNCSPCQV